MHTIDGNRLMDNREHPQVKLIYNTSQLDRIVTDTNQTFVPPEEIFGAEPEHNWCYYYQKINLAIQRREYGKAAALADEASILGYTPQNPSELIPVVEAYGQLDRIKDARKLSEEIRKDKDLRYLYCSQSWNQKNTVAYALICENK
jgi:hypothetical protein